ncbi:50S ribosomal protein L23 [uncultured archaeon]|nr:50S ribosomal protein L23 [uncultured archaeon]
MIKPITTEKAVRLIELNNTLVFETNRKDSKDEIKKEFEETFSVKVHSISTLIHGNKKIAYIRLNKNNPAIDIATKLGMI